MIKDIGAGGLGFDSRAGQIAHCRQRLATAATFLSMPWSWSPSLVTRFDVISRRMMKIFFYFDTVQQSI